MRILVSLSLSLLFGILCHGQTLTLDDYLDRGVANSAVLKDLSNQIRSNQYDSLISRANFLPQVNFNGSLLYSPAINGWGYSDVITNGQILIGTVNVNQQIFNKKTREATNQKFGLETGNLVNTRSVSLNELKNAITAQYLAAGAALKERKFQEEILATLVSEAKVLKAWTEKGIYRQTDYLSLQVEISSLEQNVRDLDLQYRKEFWNLNLICGISDTVFYDLELPLIKDPLAQKVENSLFFKRLIIDSLLIRNEKLMIDSRYKPTVNWFVDGGIINNEPRLLYQNFGISGGLSMSLPVFDGNQRKINYDKIRMREETRKNYQENFLFRYHAQLQQLQAELEKLRLLVQESEKRVALVQELVAADKVMLSAGSLLISDYILAMKNLIEAKHAGLIYQIRMQFIINEINFRSQ